MEWYDANFMTSHYITRGVTPVLKMLRQVIKFANSLLNSIFEIDDCVRMH